MRYAVLGAGQRIRPILALRTGRLAGIRDDEAVVDLPQRPQVGQGVEARRRIGQRAARKAAVRFGSVAETEKFVT